MKEKKSENEMGYGEWGGGKVGVDIILMIKYGLSVGIVKKTKNFSRC